MIKIKIHKVFDWISNLFSDDTEYRGMPCEDMPDTFMKNILYLIGENNLFWQAAMLCPCGCGDLIQLSLDTKGKPTWQVSLNERMQPTLRPSVHRKGGCRSHFVLKDGKVTWCA